METEVGDIVTEPYVALSNGEVAIGLRDTDAAAPVPTFVRPNLKDHLRALRHRRIGLDFAELADDQFHRAGFRDPNGQLIVLCEARTCSALGDDHVAVSVVGRFLEFSLPTHSVAESARFWDAFGLTCRNEGLEPAPWLHIRGRGLALGLYEGSRFTPGLTFECVDIEARVAYLEAKGCTVTRGVPFGSTASSGTTLTAPGEQRIYLLSTNA